MAAEAAAEAAAACQWKAHDWWGAAAAQGRLDAILRMGDWCYYGGMGPRVPPVTAPNKTAAAAFYGRLVAEPKRSRFTSHALFNMALMEADGSLRQEQAAAGGGGDGDGGSSGSGGSGANWTRVQELFGAAVEADPVLRRSATGAALQLALSLCAAAPGDACRAGVVGAGAAVSAVGAFFHDWFGGGSAAAAEVAAAAAVDAGS